MIIIHAMNCHDILLRPVVPYVRDTLKAFPAVVVASARRVGGCRAVTPGVSPASRGNMVSG